MEKEWDSSAMKNDHDLDMLYGDLFYITFSDPIESNTDSFVVVEEEELETSQEDDFVVVDHAASITKNQESETEEIKNGFVSEPEAETEYEADDDFGVVVADSNQKGFESKVDSVTTVSVADESKKLDS